VKVGNIRDDSFPFFVKTFVSRNTHVKMDLATVYYFFVAWSKRCIWQAPVCI
jgi:hypothetical protein